MGNKVKVPGTLWLALLMSVTSLAASGNDLRLVEAAKRGDKEAVRSLLKEGADVNMPHGDGATALAWAAHRNDLETAELLLRAGANANAANDYGVTPLSLACAQGNAAMVEKLLDAGADPNAALLSGETALMAAVNRGSVGAVKLLLAHGADANAKGGRGEQTALMWAAAEKHPEIVGWLVEHGADVHARSQGAFTPLLFAAQQGDERSARILLAAGANVNEASPKDGMTALLVASASGHEALAAFFLEQGADPNALDDKGFTALHHAAWDRNMPGLVKALLTHGANPNARLRKDPRRSANEGVSMKGATPIVLAADIRNISAVRSLAAGGADPLMETENHSTSLMMAAGVSTSISNSRSDAEKKRALETVKRLEELGVDVNAAGVYGWTALHGAAYQGLDAVIEFLVGRGAKMDVMDEFGQTPLSIAYAVVTEGLGTKREQSPRILRKSTSELLLKLGATPLAASGVKRVSERSFRVEE